MNSVKYLLIAIAFTSCTNELSNTTTFQESEVSIKDQIIQHLTDSEATIFLKDLSPLKSDESQLDTLAYTASYETQTCQAIFTSIPEIESFFIEQHFVFFTNDINLFSIVDFQYEAISQEPVNLLEPDTYRFQVEDYHILVVDTATPIGCPQNVSTIFQFE